MPPKRGRPPKQKPVAASSSARDDSTAVPEPAVENQEQIQTASGAREESTATTSTATNAPAPADKPPSEAAPQTSGQQTGDVTMTDNVEPSQSSNSPPRPPVNRLDSIRGKGAMKFKPKAVGRRAQLEREALEKDAQEKEKRRLAAVAKAQEAEAQRERLSQGHWGTRGRGRGRGAPSRGMFGPSRDSRPMDGASGPFSGPSAELQSGSRTEWTKGRGGRVASTRDSGGRKKGEGAPNASGSKPKIKSEEDGNAIRTTVEKEEDNGGRRLNIDFINVESSDDEDEVKFLGSRRRLPVRLDRDEHIERAVGVNTDASSARAAQIRQQQLQVKKEPQAANRTSLSRSHSERTKTKQKDIEFVRDERRWKGVYPDEDAAVGTQVKVEPGIDDTEMMDAPPTPLSSVQAEADPLTHDVDITTQPAAPTLKGEEPIDEAVPPTTSRTRRSAHEFRPPVLQTDEDKAEWDRFIQSRLTLRDELKMPEKSQPTQEGEEDQTQEPDLRQNKVYMFQLPPLLPNLRAVNDKGKGKVTFEPPPESGGSSKNAIKIEDGETTTEDPSNIRASDDTDFEGQIGTLSIYEDGQSAFSWGGIEYEVNVGCGGELLQEVIVTDIPKLGEQRDPAEEADEMVRDGRGEAMAMGQLSGRFVVTPAWAALFDKA